MSKVIGIVSEGPTDYMVIKTVTDKITGEDNRYLPLQPEPDMMGRYGNGWKGVWRWCKETAPLEMVMNEIQPRIDLVIIQMDGDVVRREKEVHCQCDSTKCNDKGKVFPLYCEKAKLECPAEIPCQSHNNDVADIMKHGKHVLREILNITDEKRVVITVPCDSTDAWVVAAYDDFNAIEQMEEPWKNIISKGKFYHGIRVRGDKKSAVTYSAFMEKLSDNWATVAEKCDSAKEFEKEIKRVFS